jgi:hypothetical protein
MERRPFGSPRVHTPSTVILGLVPRIQLSAGDKLGNRGDTGQRRIEDQHASEFVARWMLGTLATSARASKPEHDI